MNAFLIDGSPSFAGGWVQNHILADAVLIEDRGDLLLERLRQGLGTVRLQDLP